MRGGAITSASSVDPVNRIISRHREQRFAIYGEELVRDRNFLRETSRDLLNHRCVIYTLVIMGEKKWSGKNKLRVFKVKKTRRLLLLFFFRVIMVFIDDLKNSINIFVHSLYG